MKDFEASSHLFGANAPFVEELYERYLADPASVAPGVAAAVRRVAGGIGSEGSSLTRR
jgi:2-oxoglutarate dehydrogenase complex dehydrogenase (E1) component-like enzyme